MLQEFSLSKMKNLEKFNNFYNENFRNQRIIYNNICGHIYMLHFRWRSSIQSAKTRPGADYGSDYELLIT